MSKAIERKQELVNQIAEEIKASSSIVIADYRGLNVAEVTELRNNMRNEGLTFKVYKNSLVRRAMEQAGIEGLNEVLTGPNAIAFSSEDVVAPARVLNDFAKNHENLELKAGVIEGKVALLDEVKAIATLPSKEGLLSMLLSVLTAPMRNTALAVKAVADQKAEQEA
ncbi:MULTISPECIES: 50S ribosomal protein L10 [unclassified Gemella]|uniref:50S ribosomal protein L10 n=1 Tax=unclassified Gemella TaxID=2624949 RepID=UPI001C0551EC|nr:MULTISPECIES: 50S ribosomal protein L10 [unclassified Gemella]MBU0279018.1 50S ribosomal protein L10 [Gemella sp. zg-1178]QWQ39090.1 50S ribosomal protein L10 [Gemella sp. zg-570]